MGGQQNVLIDTLPPPTPFPEAWNLERPRRSERHLVSQRGVLRIGSSAVVAVVLHEEHS